MTDWSELYRRANANLSQSARERRAGERLIAAQRRTAQAALKQMERDFRRQAAARKRELKAELKDLTKECNRLDRKMRSKAGLTSEEHGAYEELDAMRWDLVRQLTGEDWR